MGRGVKYPEKEITKLEFACEVRQTNTQKITIKNDKDIKWTLNPSIMSEDETNATWIINKDIIEIGPGSSAEVEVT